MSRRAFVRGAMATGAMIALAGGSLTALADEGGEGSDGDAPSGDDVPEPDEVDASGAVDGGSLGFYITNPVGIEPFDTQENQGIAVASNLFDTLVTWDWGNQTIAPLAAESWEVNEDAPFTPSTCARTRPFTTASPSPRPTSSTPGSASAAPTSCRRPRRRGTRSSRSWAPTR